MISIYLPTVVYVINCVACLFQGTNGPRPPPSPYPTMKGGPRTGNNPYRAVTWSQPYSGQAAAPASQVRYTAGAVPPYSQSYSSQPNTVSQSTSARKQDQSTKALSLDRNMYTNVVHFTNNVTRHTHNKPSSSRQTGLLTQ